MEPTPTTTLEERLALYPENMRKWLELTPEGNARRVGYLMQAKDRAASIAADRANG